jgi:hypothetical protein
MSWATSDASIDQDTGVRLTDNRRQRRELGETNRAANIRFESDNESLTHRRLAAAVQLAVGEVFMSEEIRKPIDRNLIEKLFTAPGSESWRSWDDVFHWVEERPDRVGGGSTARRLMEALDRTQRHGVPFTRDIQKALSVLQRHASPIEEIHWRRT